MFLTCVACTPISNNTTETESAKTEKGNAFKTKILAITRKSLNVNERLGVVPASAIFPISGTEK